MVTKIFYFSGTGNSLFVAKKIQSYLGSSELIPIVKSLKKIQNRSLAGKVILVFPVYAMTVPLPVRDFIKTFDFTRVAYFSAIVTRLGLYFNDFKRIDKLAKPAILDSHFILNMGNSDVKAKNYKCPSKSDIAQIEEIALQKLKNIVETIEKNETSRNKDSNPLVELPFGDFRDRIIEYLVPKLMTFSKVIGGVNYFYNNNKCNGCGLCSKVCLSGKITIENKQPVWRKSTLCYMCYACINYCPEKAIEISSLPGVPSYTYENERYCHPYASFLDIRHQKG